MNLRNRRFIKAAACRIRQETVVVLRANATPTREKTTCLKTGDRRKEGAKKEVSFKKAVHFK